MEENVFSGIDKAQIKLPLEILEDYKQQFTEAFGQTLVFQVLSKLEDQEDEWAKLDPFKELREPAEQKYVSRVYIVAPALKNYRMLVMKVSYLRSTVYPCELYNAFTEKSDNFENPEVLKEAMAKLFLSDEFKNPIKMLLTQL